MFEKTNGGEWVVVALSFIIAFISTFSKPIYESSYYIAGVFVGSFIFSLIGLYIIYWIINKVYPKSEDWGIVLWILAMIGIPLIIILILAFAVGFIFGLAGSIDNPSSSPIISVIPTIAPIYPRPLTGTLVSGAIPMGGFGEFTIDNTAGGTDAVVVLTYKGIKNPFSGVFIRRGETYTFHGIKDSIYDLYFNLGDNWDPDAKKFTNHPSYQRFTDDFIFSTTYIEYQTYKVTLYPVVDGNAKTDNVGENDFPKL